MLNIERYNSDADISEIIESFKQIMSDFKIGIEIVGTSINSRTIRLEIKMPSGVRIRKLSLLADDIAVAIGVKSVMINPLPEKKCIAIEFPRNTPGILNLGNILCSKSFWVNSYEIPFIIGETPSGKILIEDIANLPHLLCAGSTGSGKSVFINSLIISMLYRLSPSELRLILIDPKCVELSNYNGLPHLLHPVITSPDEAVSALQWAEQEMRRRYDLLLGAGVKNIQEYNKTA